MKPARIVAALGFLAAAVAAALMLGSRLSADDPPATTNGSVSFDVICEHGGEQGVIDQTIRAVVTVEKPGRKPLVNGNPGPDQVDGGHNFPAGTTAGGVADYYRLLLLNAGWLEGTDFSVAGGTINFRGISKLDSGSSHGHLKATGSTDSKDVPYTPVPGEEPKKKTCMLERSGTTQDGILTIVGFGLEWNAGNTVTSSWSIAHVPFSANDSASAVMMKVRDALVAADWAATINANGAVVITKNSHGDFIYSIWQSVAYSETTGHTENEDHWIWDIE